VTCSVVIKHRPQVTAGFNQRSAGPESLQHQRVAQAGTISDKVENTVSRGLADFQNKDIVARSSAHVVGSDSTARSVIAAQTEAALFDKAGALGTEEIVSQ
jgi:hypothetical protein